MSQAHAQIIRSINPANGKLLAEIKPTLDVTTPFIQAEKALKAWQALTLDQRFAFLENYGNALKKNKDALAKTISQEMGKPLWESTQEVDAMIKKIKISFDAYLERCPLKTTSLPQGKAYTQHKAHGVCLVLGPYNFPGHLPNGHMVPALLAGNTIVFKPSEHTPLTGQLLMRCFEEAQLPKGVINLLLVGREEKILEDPRIRAIFFTGSSQTGLFLLKKFHQKPGTLLALEMGGNNPIVLSETKHLKEAAYTITQSAFITSGQRCTCCRRAIITQEEIIPYLKKVAEHLSVGDYSKNPFMGPLVCEAKAKETLHYQQIFIESGAEVILEGQWKGNGFFTPAILDTTGINLPDQEIFGPLLQVKRVKNFAEALIEANQTAYGLAASLLSDNPTEWDTFFKEIKAGVINHNVPTTGALSTAPFGGLGLSGNYHPSAFYAADYCAHPVATMAQESLQGQRFPGMPDVL